jgi:tetratricopeptide (TPR) repeat protein
MRKRKRPLRRRSVVLLAGFIGIVLVLVLILIALGQFPGRIKESPYLDEVVTEGRTSLFKEGVVYRYDELPPLLDVSGDHYEMGLQYGVLLRSDIVDALDSYEQIINWTAQEAGVPDWLLVSVVKIQARRIMAKLPERFMDEVRGVSDGSGVPVDTILTISLMYDVVQSVGCTSVLMRGEDGSIIHGRNQDTADFGGRLMNDIPVIVKRRAEGYRTVTNTDYFLYLGVNTGYNDAGLAMSEQTQSTEQTTFNGSSILYLARAALEEASALEELNKFFESYPVNGGSGIVWSDRDTGEGLISELLPTDYDIIEMEEPLLWEINALQSEKLTPLEPEWDVMDDSKWERVGLADSYPIQAAYSVDDAVAFLRLQTDPEGINYAWYGTAWPICNQTTQQMVIFDPDSDGMYVSFDEQFACADDVYHIHEDFSQPPERVYPALEIDPVMLAVARINNGLLTSTERFNQYLELVEEFPNNAMVHFWVAYEALDRGEFELMAEHADRAYELDPTIPDVRLMGGLAASYQGNTATAIDILEAIESDTLSPYHNAVRLGVLEQLYTPVDPALAGDYGAELNELLTGLNAHSYYASSIQPIVECFVPSS